MAKSKTDAQMIDRLKREAPEVLSGRWILMRWLYGLFTVGPASGTSVTKRSKQRKKHNYQIRKPPRKHGPSPTK